MINFKNKKILITGATGGIGNALVKKFISLEGNVLATGTNTDKLDDLLDGINSDIKDKVILNSKKDLLIYSYRVAGTVGLMTQGVIGIDSAYTSNPNKPCPNTSQAAIALGIANQLTNILRDVGEYRSRGRIFIPKEDLERFDYSENDLAHLIANQLHQ